MKKPEFPTDEQTRLETLKALSILDSPPEERFDRITRMAKRLFDVPIALVSLVDENRQWFKSRIGLIEQETSREISFCGHALLEDHVFIVPNAIEDLRFKDNPLVVNQPHIRFYAGCPLRAPNRQKLGTLCIIDRSPRQFGADDIQLLEDLAAMVEQELLTIKLATMDDLTNISNRRGFSLLAEHSLSLCRRENLPATLVYFDINNLKPINDTYGHAEGDRALKIFAEELKAVFRESDVIARLGGDEFAVLLSNNQEQTTLRAVKRLSEILENRNREVDHDYTISFSYGIVEYNSNQHASLDDLLNEGDALMYRTKKSRGASYHGVRPVQAEQSGN